MAMGIDRQIQARMALGQDRLQQEYAQTQQLIDLLALQKLSKEKAEAARAVQASMQTNPATVKDQLEQQLIASNKQGIASMMPGIQMQGQRMAQAQARQAAGIPSQPAPNMARMAGGGIVAFQEGGDVAAVREYIRLREKLKDPNITPEAAQTISIMLEDMKRQAQDPSRFIRDVETSSGFDPAEEYERSMQEQGGMYGGGVVGYETGGLLNTEELQLAEEMMADRPAVSPPTVISPAERRAQREAENEASRKRYAEKQRKREELAAMGLTVPEINAFMERDEQAATQAATQAPKMPDEELESILSMMEDPNDYSPQEVPTRETLNRYEEGEGDASTVMGQTSVDDILAEMELLAGSRPTTSNEMSELTDLLKTRTEAILAPGYAESQRSARESAAQTAYAVPEELKQLYRDRQTELESLKRSPEDIRRRELAALLGGIASSPYIARSGTQAYRGMEQVREQARQENIDTAQKNFDMSKELVNLDRDASIKAFDAGLTALGEANSAQITAIQTVNNMIQGVQNRELEATLANQSNQLSYLQAQFQNELKKIDVATGIDRDRQATLRTLYTNATDFYDNIVTSKAEQSALLGADAEMMQNINTIYDSLINGAANTIDSISQLLDVGGTIPPITRPATSGTSSAVSAADELLGIE